MKVSLDLHVKHRHTNNKPTGCTDLVREAIAGKVQQATAHDDPHDAAARGQLLRNRDTGSKSMSDNDRRRVIPTGE